MSRDNEARPSVTKSTNVETYAPEQARTLTTEQEPDKKSRRGLVIGAGAVATSLVAAGALWLGVGNKGEARPATPPPTPSTSAPATPGPTETVPTPAATEGVALPPELQPENLMNLTPAQIEKVFQIRADQVKTPEDYATAYAQRYEAALRAGCTKQEWQPFSNSGKGAFSNAMIQKYFEPMSKGWLGKVGNPYDMIVALDRCNVFMTVDKKYVTTIDVVPGSAKSTRNPDGSIDYVFTLHGKDNYSEITSVIGGDKRNINDIFAVTHNGVKPDQSGALHAATASTQLLN